MMQGRGKVGLFVAAFSSMIVLSGCQSEPAATEAELNVADVQGVSFNAPAPVDDSATTQVAAATESETVAPPPPPELESGDSAEEAPEISAETSAMDIAAIPSATPMPSPTPDPVVEQPVEVARASSNPDDYVAVSFKKLSSFKYVEPIPGQGEDEAAKTDQIPAEIKQLDGSKAIVEGWMVPMEVAEDGSVKSFVLVKTQPQCCFGDMQAMNEWVDVMMAPGKNAEFNVDLPMKVYGELEVGEKMEDGFVLSVYRMKADRVEL